MHTLDLDCSSHSYSERPSTPASGLKAHIHQLLPKHALFHIRLDIHQLENVPLIKGHFATRWKFQHVHVLPGSRVSRSSLLGKVRSSRSRPASRSRREVDVVEESTEDSNSRARDSQSTMVGSEAHTFPKSDTFNGESATPGTLTPASTMSGDSDGSYPDMISSQSTNQSFLTSSLSSGQPSLKPTRIPYLMDQSSIAEPEYIAQARGMTVFNTLKAHTTTWEHRVDAVVRMDVDRDTKDLLPSELKLVVMQQVIPGDLDAPQNPRFGVVYINLAEYAGAGPNGDGKGGTGMINRVERRYLLEDNKINATLKLTIEVEHIGGETDFIPPLLTKTGIFADVTGGLLENDVFTTRPNALDLFGPSQEPIKRTGRFRASSKAKASAKEVPFDIERLPLAFGSQTTETMIEALFNPVTVTDQRKATPFTVYQPPVSSVAVKIKAREEKIAEENTIGKSTGHRMMPPSSSAASISSMSTDSSGTVESSVTTTSTKSSSSSRPNSRNVGDIDPSGGMRNWWKKRTSTRSHTPTAASTLAH